MLVSLIPAPLNYFPGVRLVLFDTGIGKQTNVVVDVKVEQWSRLPAGLIHDEVIEGVVLYDNRSKIPRSIGFRVVVDVLLG